MSEHSTNEQSSEHPESDKASDKQRAGGRQQSGKRRMGWLVDFVREEEPASDPSPSADSDAGDEVATPEHVNGDTSSQPADPVEERGTSETAFESTNGEDTDTELQGLRPETKDMPDVSADASDPVEGPSPPLEFSLQSLEDDVAIALCEREHLAPSVARQVNDSLVDPHASLWRTLIEEGHVDSSTGYATAADILGYGEAEITPDHPDADFVSAILGLFPHGVQDSLEDLNLLPVEMTIDPEAGGHRLTIATHDPACEEVEELVQSLSMAVTLVYAPEDLVRERLSKTLSPDEETQEKLEALARSTEESAVKSEDPVSDRADQEEAEHPEEWTPTPDAELAHANEQSAESLDETSNGPASDELWSPFDGEKQDDSAGTEPVAEEDDAFGFDEDDLGWEPFAGFGDDEDLDDPFGDEEEPTAEEADTVPDERDDGDASALDREDTTSAPSEARPPAPHQTPASPRQPASSEEVSPSASVSPRQSSLSADELAQAMQTDQQADDDVLVEEEIEPAQPFGADSEESASFDGSSVDLPDDTPVADTNWNEEEQPNFAEEALEDPELQKIKKKDRVIAALFSKGVIDASLLRKAKVKRDEEGLKESFWRIVAQIDGANREAIFSEAANVYAFPTAEIREGKPDPEFARSVTDTFDEQYRDELLDLGVLPYEVDLENNSGAIKVVFITHDPTRPDVHRMMQKLKLERFELRYAPERVVRGLIAEAFPRKNEYLERIDKDGEGTVDLGMSYEEEDNLVDEDQLEAEMSRSKLINLFEATLVEATRKGVSDIHIWPNADKQVEIHFRMDGRLQCWHVENKVHPEALIAVIKDNSMNVDRFEREAAQDGFIQRWIDDALIRFRVSVMPIANAASEVRSESIVIRVLDDRKVIKDLRKLGLQDLAFERFKRAISQPHGMVILTGPTGSGKTTTLYAALHEVVSPEVNVLTVEDPVEYILPGVRQIKLNHKLGLEDALRSILRHDPDVVMVGEMRDRHTAELAIKLANTGHLTFSTLHTNDAASAVSRLYKMGVEPFLIAYAINLVVAQRLIRKLCDQCCKVDPDPDPIFLKNLGFTEQEIEETTFYTEGKDPNCPKCGGLGYRGRRAVTEAMYFTREMRHLIADSEGKLSDEDIKNLAIKDGMLTLQDSAKLIVRSGETSAEEMMRVVASRD